MTLFCKCINLIVAFTSAFCIACILKRIITDVQQSTTTVVSPMEMHMNMNSKSSRKMTFCMPFTRNNSALET